jgi:hypothetical protein
MAINEKVKFGLKYFILPWMVFIILFHILPSQFLAQRMPTNYMVIWWLIGLTVFIVWIAYFYFKSRAFSKKLKFHSLHLIYLFISILIILVMMINAILFFLN